MRVDFRRPKVLAKTPRAPPTTPCDCFYLLRVRSRRAFCSPATAALEGVVQSLTTVRTRSQSGRSTAVPFGRRLIMSTRGLPRRTAAARLAAAIACRVCRSLGPSCAAAQPSDWALWQDVALDNLGETRFVLILGFRRRRSLSKRHSHQIHGYLRLRTVPAKLDRLRHVCTGPVGPTSTVRIRTTLQQARVQKTPQLSGSSTPISLGKSATPLKNSRVKTPTDDCCHSSRPVGRQIKRTAVFI